MTAIGMRGRIAIGDDHDVLNHVARPGCALAIWWRRIPERLREALDTLDPVAIDDVSADVDPYGSVAPLLGAAGYPRAACVLLGADMERLLGRHAALTGEDRLHVRLAAVGAGRHAPFDAEHRPLSLTCTYIGPGMQWCCTEARDAICEVPTGAVGVFKGQTRSAPPLIVRRSPPIATDDVRLALSIDPPCRGRSSSSKPRHPRPDSC